MGKRKPLQLPQDILKNVEETQARRIRLLQEEAYLIEHHTSVFFNKKNPSYKYNHMLPWGQVIVRDKSKAILWIYNVNDNKRDTRSA